MISKIIAILILWNSWLNWKCLPNFSGVDLFFFNNLYQFSQGGFKIIIIYDFTWKRERQQTKDKERVLPTILFLTYILDDFVLKLKNNNNNNLKKFLFLSINKKLIKGPEECEDDIKSSCPLCPRRHTCYNDRNKGSHSARVN